MGEHVYHAGRFETIAVDMAELLEITGERTGMAGDIDDALSAERSDPRQHLERTCSRRIEQHTAESTGQRRCTTLGGRQIGRMERRVADAVEGGVLAAARHQSGIPFDADHLACAQRKRQREVSQTTEEVEHPVIRADLETIDRLRDQHPVDRSIDLDDIPGGSSTLKTSATASSPTATSTCGIVRRLSRPVSSSDKGVIRPSSGGANTAHASSAAT
jgi:hypothetical protein